jgi:hypothetical protein
VIFSGNGAKPPTGEPDVCPLDRAASTRRGRLVAVLLAPGGRPEDGVVCVSVGGPCFDSQRLVGQCTPQLHPATPGVGLGPTYL